MGALDIFVQKELSDTNSVIITIQRELCFNEVYEEDEEINENSELIDILRSMLDSGQFFSYEIGIDAFVEYLESSKEEDFPEEESVRKVVEYAKTKGYTHLYIDYF